MRIPIIEIGNSRGIRIPQAILKQVEFGAEVELDVEDGRITLQKSRQPVPIPDFCSIPYMDDQTIQEVLRKISGTDLVTALVGAPQGVKEAIYRNLSKRVFEHVSPTVERLEKGDARDLIIEQSRNRISEACVQVAGQ